MAAEWKTRQRTIGNKEFFEVYKEIPQTGDIITRGGLWKTQKEAVMLAFRLNADEWDKEAFG